MSLDFNAAVESLQRTAQIPRDRAEQIIRAQAPSLGVSLPPDPDATRDAHVLEKTEQSEITKLFRKHGFAVRSTSQARPSKISIGFPDLFVTHKTLPLGFFFETKRQVGSVMSDAQKDFAADCWRCGIKCYAGDRFVARKILDEHAIQEMA